MYAFAASTFFFVSGVGGSWCPWPGVDATELEFEPAEDDPPNGLLPVILPSHDVPPGLLISGTLGGARGHVGSVTQVVALLESRRIFEIKKVGEFISVSSTSDGPMNASLVAAQLEEFRFALCEVNAEVRVFSCVFRFPE
jgi:hypothetical protein|tara:strand:- start:610 stop:1029 length:420 start_codon:yes stop_codon:yes gene_type:complete